MTEHIQTLKYYDDNAQGFISDTVNVDMQELYAKFLQKLPNNKRLSILDLGCGSGRDSRHFTSLGHQITAIDGSQKLIDLAKNTACTNFAQYQNITWHCLRFNEIVTQPWKNHFDGIWACASLLHVPYVELPDLLTELLITLKPDGVLYASFKYGDSERVVNGRFFCDMDEERWQTIFYKLKKDMSYKSWVSTDARAYSNEEWFNAVLTL